MKKRRVVGGELYIATLRAIFKAPSRVEALLTADQIMVNGKRDLDPEEGDTLDVTQVTTNTLDLSPQETLITLRKARNLCIKTRTQQGVDVARELDKFIHVLKNRLEGSTGYEMAGYNYGDFVDVTDEVLNGGNPIHM